MDRVVGDGVYGVGDMCYGGGEVGGGGGRGLGEGGTLQIPLYVVIRGMGLLGEKNCGFVFPLCKP